MLRFLPVLALALTIFPNLADAQYPRAGDHRGTLGQQRACRSDVLRLCRDMRDEDDYAIADCLKAHARRLTPTCLQALERADEQ